MNDHEFARSLLEVVASTPTEAPWNAIALPVGNWVFIWDRREESDVGILEVIAGEFGRVVAMPAPCQGVGGEWIIGALIDADLDAVEASARLRAAYAIGSSPDDPAEGVF
jgi:hypothetical protein